MNLIIRKEEKNDYFEVEALIKKAFWNVNVPGCDEHYVAHQLRKHPDFIPELSLLIEENHRIVASVMYTKAFLVNEKGGQKEILTFGPLAVDPAYQRCGYGKALLEHSFALAENLGYDTIVIFGHPGNYVNRGFKSCKKYNICLKNGVFPTAMLVKELIPGCLTGELQYYRESEAYQVDMDGFEAFDRYFEQYIPEEKPCQEEFYIYSNSRVRSER